MTNKNVVYNHKPDPVTSIKEYKIDDNGKMVLDKNITNKDKYKCTGAIDAGYSVKVQVSRTGATKEEALQNLLAVFPKAEPVFPSKTFHYSDLL